MLTGLKMCFGGSRWGSGEHRKGAGVCNSDKRVPRQSMNPLMVFFFHWKPFADIKQKFAIDRYPAVLPNPSRQLLSRDCKVIVRDAHSVGIVLADGDEASSWRTVPFIPTAQWNVGVPLKVRCWRGRMESLK